MECVLVRDDEMGDQRIILKSCNLGKECLRIRICWNSIPSGFKKGRKWIYLLEI